MVAKVIIRKTKPDRPISGPGADVFSMAGFGVGDKTLILLSIEDVAELK